MTKASPKLLSGGNPQIAKGEGEAPVAAYIDAMPGWKREAGLQIDQLITKLVPGVSKAVKWNSPFYGRAPGLWFLSFHCFTHYIKVTFFRGTSLNPPPPEPSRSGDTRYFHIREGEEFAPQLAEWVTQAQSLPGEKL